MGVAVVSPPDGLHPPYPPGLVEALAARVAEGVAVVTPETEGQGPIILFVNEAFTRMFGGTTESVVGKPLVATIDPAYGSGLLAKLRTAGAMPSREMEQSLVETSRGRTLLVEWNLAPVTGVDGRVACYVSIQRDITEAALRPTSSRSRDLDPLTGLPSQVRFLSDLGRSVERAARGGARGFTVVGLDLRGLEGIQRRWGTLVANVVVEAAAWRIRRAMRPGDLVARLGSTRIGILLEHLRDASDVEGLRRRIERAIEDPYVVGGQRLEARATGGILPLLGEDPRTAEAILEILKQRLTTQRLRTDRPRLLDLFSLAPEEERDLGAAALSRAIDGHELTILYQPVIALDSGRIVGLEALLRWKHPSRGLLEPASFLPHARRAGMMVALDRWVLETACRDHRAWRESLRPVTVPPVHVNVSDDEFRDPGFVSHVSAALPVVGHTHPAGLRLEVSEATLAGSVAHAGRILASLKRLRVDVWVQEFGQGGLPAADVVRLPFDHVKLDPALTWRSENGNGIRAMTPLFAALLRLARDLGREPVAGNVQTARERDLLRAAECRLGQGFALSRPIPRESVPGLIQDGP